MLARTFRIRVAASHIAVCVRPPERTRTLSRLASCILFPARWQSASQCSKIPFLC